MDMVGLAKYLLEQINSSVTDPVPKEDMPAYAAFSMFRTSPNMDIYLFNADMLYFLYSEGDLGYVRKLKELLFGSLGYMDRLRDETGMLPHGIKTEEPLCIREAISLAHRFAHEAHGAYEKGNTGRMGRYIATTFIGAGYALMYINGSLKEKEGDHAILSFPG